ncbi:MAG: MiaB/RimO family radical SAM methylthiotransferase [Actinobacteria bacterium]|nr:MiaB/RimO family radical SAM methylthiotransferase [Actinomycetota bacterium]
MTDAVPRVAFVTLGCKVNQTESEAVAAEVGVHAPGCALADADVVIVNTCTVTGEADRKARKAVRHALGLAREPIVIATGCLATLDADGLRRLGDRVLVEADKTAVATLVRERVGTVAEAVGARPARTRAQLKVQDGCDVFCAYCIVPHARGLPRAVPAALVVAEAERVVAAGAAEIVLTGINIGRYDDRGTRLPQLLRRVAATGVPRLRVSSIEPGDVTDEFLAAAQEIAAFCPHLHVPLQSGSDAVLARMGRPYTTSEFALATERARKAFPGVAISTDLIAGFPGESGAEHAETLAFVERIGFSRLHVFRYSARPGTPAAAMPEQVAPAVRSVRAAELRSLGEKQAREYAESRLGREDELLVERVMTSTPRAVEGTAREYVRARIAHTTAAPGELVRFVGARVDHPAVLIGEAAE